jgi:hypothetical protein
MKEPGIALGDIDGDGILDYVLRSSATLSYFKAYRSDGTFLWDIDVALGNHTYDEPNWSFPCMLWDMDNDGKAEVFFMRYEADKSYSLVMYDGLTGDLKDEALLSLKKCHRNMFAIAYLDGENPSVIITHGTYKGDSPVVIALDRNLDEMWRTTFDDMKAAGGSNAGQGAHRLGIADMDGDGRDEVLHGDNLLDDDGQLIWSINRGHVDHNVIVNADGDDGLEVLFAGEAPWGDNHDFDTWKNDPDNYHPNTDVTFVNDASKNSSKSKPNKYWYRRDYCDVNRCWVGNVTNNWEGVEMYVHDEEGGPTDILGINNEMRQRSSSGEFKHIMRWTGDDTWDVMEGFDFYKGMKLKLKKWREKPFIEFATKGGLFHGDVIGDFREEIFSLSTDMQGIVIYTNTDIIDKREVTPLQDMMYREHLARTCVGYTSSNEHHKGGYSFPVKEDNEPKLMLSSPNGGENWEVGSNQNITWSSVNFTGNIKIEYSTDNGNFWIDVISSAPNNGSYNWTIPDISSSNCKVRISDAATGIPFDESNSKFTIFQPQTPLITLLSPNGNENWEQGGTRTIQWSSGNFDNNVKIEYSTNNGSLWSNIVSSTSNDGSFNWVIPGIVSSACKVRISDVEDGEPFDESDNTFSIFQPEPSSITVLSPNGGEIWQVGTSQSIQWNSSNFNDQVKIEYFVANSGNWIEIVSSTPNDGFFNWAVPDVPSTDCKVRVSDAEDRNPSDESNNVFRISKQSSTMIILHTPNGGENWQVGSVQTIQWSTHNFDDNIKIELSIYEDNEWKGIVFIRSTANNGTFNWTVPNTPSSHCRIRISDLTDGNPSDISDAVFVISESRAIDVKDSDIIPQDFVCHQNYPNPFNPETNIRFQIPNNSTVKLLIYNVLGEKVRTLVNEYMGAGNHNITWNSRDENGQHVPSGTYIYRIQAADWTDTRKMILLK